MIENKKILILGMAKSGFEVAKLLSKGNNKIIVTDQKDQDKSQIEELEKLGISFVKTIEPEVILDNTFDMLIKNPAVLPYHPCVEKARSLGIPIVNEMEVAYHYINKPVRIIGVTGSNGKTTTVTLIHEVLKKANTQVKLGGNIGTPLSKIVNDLEENDILLLEISDHQLIDFHDFKTDISVLTNLCPTHLDYHGSYENYKDVKKKIFEHHTNKDYAIINAGNYDSMELTKDIASTKYYFNSEENFIGDDGIYVDNKKVIDKSEIIIKGIHNYENILVTYLVAKLLDIDFKYVMEVLKEFKGVEHRLEFVRSLNGVNYYNDSKSTNPTSTITALNSFDKNIDLILGGMERSQDFNDLSPYKDKIKKIYAIGEVRKRIMEFAKENDIEAEEFENLSSAMKKIKEEVASGDTVLLSPASASWDQYLRFEDRGNEFKEIVNNF